MTIKYDIFCIIICFICISRINTVAYSNDFQQHFYETKSDIKYVYKTFYGENNS